MGLIRRTKLKVKARLTSPKAKKNWAATKKGAVKVARYIQAVDSNIDNTFSIPRRYPDNTLSNRNRSRDLVKIVKKRSVKKKPKKMVAPKGYRLVRKNPIPKGYKLVRK